MEAKDSRELVRVVIVGGGVAGLEAALALRDLAGGLASVTLVAETDRFTFVPASVGAPFGRAVVRKFDLFRIANDVGARLVVGTVTAVEAANRRVILEGGEALGYDALLIACGASPQEAVPGAITFGGAEDVDLMRELMTESRARPVSRLVFAIPASVGWTLPLYELCLLSAQHLIDNDAIDRYSNGRMRRESIRIGLVTPEAIPLEAFGSDASRAVSAMLENLGIVLHPMRTPVRFHDGVLATVPGGDGVAADRVVALPRLRGVPLGGTVVDGDGLIRTDPHGRLDGMPGVYAAGDITAFPIKQGGIAAQQADAAAQMIAATAGASITPQPFDPVLRGLLLTGTDERYLEAEVEGGKGASSTVAEQPLWWPPGKLAARYLTPYLATLDHDRTQQF